MTLSWRYFGGASILAAGLLLKAGAPLPAVLLGIACAALFTKTRSSGGSK